MSGSFGTVSTSLAFNRNSGGDFSTRIGLHPPGRPLVVELGGEHLGVEPDLGPDPVLVGAMIGISNT